MTRLIVGLLAALFLGGCANLRKAETQFSPYAFVFGGNANTHTDKTNSPPFVSESAVLSKAAKVASLPPRQQQMVCSQARVRLRHASPKDVRLMMAAMGSVVPGCFSPDDVQWLLKGLDVSPLADYLRALDARQTADRQALAQAQGKVKSLEAKLKALTRIEQQLNQVKDRELQDQGQGKTTPR